MATCQQGIIAFVLAASVIAAGKNGQPTDKSKPRSTTFKELLQMPFSKPIARIHYGDQPLQFADLRMPEGKGPHPVAVLIHGGCWLAEVADSRYFNAMADALTKKGMVTYNIEYRRVGDKGGGWPGTFLDVAKATDHLHKIAREYNLDLSRVIVVGHSAGGHLALWTAARHKLPKDSELFTPDPLKILAAVNLAGPGELTNFTATDKHACGDAAERLLGGKPGEVPKRYEQASPSKLLPLGVRQLCIAGAEDNLVPPIHIRAHADAAKKSGDPVEYIEIKDAGHFDLVNPRSVKWPRIEQVIVGVADVRSSSVPSIRIIGVHPLEVTPELFADAMQQKFPFEMSEKDRQNAEQHVRNELQGAVLIELLIINADERLKKGFSQSPSGKPGDDDQAEYSPVLLDRDGTSILDDSFFFDDWASKWDRKSGVILRTAFYLHFYNPILPLNTPYGNVEMPKPTPIPSRLKKIRYEPVT